MIDLANCVIIECCRDCAKHEWCTSHDEERYAHYFNTIKREIETEFDAIQVYANLDLHTGRQTRPTLGAFEILFRGELIFSKLYTRAWPHLGYILNRIDILQGGNGGYDDRFIPKIPPKSKNVTVNRSASVRRGHGSGSKSQSQPHSPQSFPNISPQQSIYAGQRSSKNSKNDTSFEGAGPGYLPSIKGIKGNGPNGNGSNSQIDNSEERRWPKTKFYRRYQSPLRLHALNENGNRDSSSFFTEKKEETLDYMSFETRILPDETGRVYQEETGRDRSVVLPSLNQPVSRKLSLKNTSMQTEDLKEVQKLEETIVKEDEKPKCEKVDSAMQTSLEMFRPVREGTPRRGSNRELLPPISKDKSPEDHWIKPEMETPIREVEKPEDVMQRNATGGDSAASLIRPKETEKSDGDDSEQELGKEPPIIFPQKKRSTIQVPKEKGIKKKITIQGDKDEDCVIKIETDTPDILNMPTQELVMSKGGGPMKISLKFAPQEEAKVENFMLRLYKNNLPWLKVVIQAQYI